MSLWVVFIFTQPHTSFEPTTCLKQKERDMGSVVEKNPFGLIFQNIAQPTGWLQDFIKKKEKEKGKGKRKRKKEKEKEKKRKEKKTMNWQLRTTRGQSLTTKLFLHSSIVS